MGVSAANVVIGIRIHCVCWVCVREDPVTMEGSRGVLCTRNMYTRARSCLLCLFKTIVSRIVHA